MIVDMRSSAKYGRSLAVGLLSLAFCFFASLQAQANEGKGVVRTVRGAAQVRASATAPWAKLMVGSVIKPGGAIRTAKGSTVDVFLGENGPVVRVTGDTELDFSKLAYNKTDADTVIETELDLKSGEVLGNVRKLAAASRFDVKTPSGVCGIRGAEFGIKIVGNTVQATCTSGQIKVTVILPGGNTFSLTLGPNQSTTFTSGNVNPPTVVTVAPNSPIVEALKTLVTDTPFIVIEPVPPPPPPAPPPTPPSTETVPGGTSGAVQ